jgi:hypothetical protein
MTFFPTGKTPLLIKPSGMFPAVATDTLGVPGFFAGRVLLPAARQTRRTVAALGHHRGVPAIQTEPLSACSLFPIGHLVDTGKTDGLANGGGLFMTPHTILMLFIELMDFGRH